MCWAVFEYRFTFHFTLVFLMQTSSLMPAGCATVQFNSVTNYPELVQTPQVQGSFHETLPPSDSSAKCWVASSYPYFCQVKFRGFHDSLPSGSIIFWNNTQTLLKVLYLQSQLIIKDAAQEQTSGRDARVMSGWRLTGAPVPCSQGTRPGWCLDQFTNQGALQTSLFGVFVYGGFITWAHWLNHCSLVIELNLWTLCPAEDWGVGLRFQSSDHVLLLLEWLDPPLKPPKSPPWVTLLAQTQTWSGQRGSFWMTKDTPVTQEIPRVFEPLCRNQGQRPNRCIFMSIK